MSGHLQLKLLLRGSFYSNGTTFPADRCVILAAKLDEKVCEPTDEVTLVLQGIRKQVLTVQAFSITYSHAFFIAQKSQNDIADLKSKIIMENATPAGKQFDLPTIEIQEVPYRQFDDMYSLETNKVTVFPASIPLDKSFRFGADNYGDQDMKEFRSTLTAIVGHVSHHQDEPDQDAQDDFTPLSMQKVTEPFSPMPSIPLGIEMGTPDPKRQKRIIPSPIKPN